MIKPPRRRAKGARIVTVARSAAPTDDDRAIHGRHGARTRERTPAFRTFGLRSASLISVAIVALFSTPLTASADEAATAEMTEALGTVPPFIALLPEGAQAGAWELMKGLSGNPDGEIPPKFRELIALGVAAQIPCVYCTYAHTTFAKANGATDAEIQEAIGYGAEVRLWSTILNGSQYDLGKWRSEIDGIVSHVTAR